MTRWDPWLHRSALVLVVLAMAVIITGAFITSAAVAARQSHSVISPFVNEGPHRALAVALIVFTLGICNSDLVRFNPSLVTGGCLGRRLDAHHRRSRRMADISAFAQGRSLPRAAGSPLLFAHRRDRRWHFRRLESHAGIGRRQ